MKNNWRPLLLALCVLLLGAFVLYYMEDVNKSATRSIFAMDTYMEITAYGRDSEAAVEAAAQEIQRLDALLSTGLAGSEVSELNRNKTGILSDDTAYLLRYSLALWQETDGAFDITVYPVMRAWGFDTQAYRVPAQEELAELTAWVDTSGLIYNETDGTLALPEAVEIDFGGIAKGYTAWRAAQIMQEYHIRSAKLNLGGNVQLVGARPDGSAWRIAIKSPDGATPYLGILSVKDKAVVTSGGYERYFEEAGVVYHHILDPRTGRPAQSGLVSVTIVSADGTLADGLSTAVYVMGRKRAEAFWRENRDYFDMVLFDEENRLYVTEGIASDFAAADEMTVEIIRR
ncbi:MAG: FAD:protein FMN transferase [Roseburia sp.]|nr:FAD:protein FMN transferase [Roseburia sp.]